MSSSGSAVRQIRAGLPERAAFDRLLRPQSVAIVGASSTPGSLGESVLANLERAAFRGDLHLINPKRTEIRGRACLSSIDDLPEGVDCAVLAIPRAGVKDALLACARRRVRSVIVFSAGFAESGPEGRAEQEELARIAREYDMLLEGPNCLGMVNAIDDVSLTFVLTQPEPLAEQRRVAIVSQSGAMAAVLGVSLRTHGIPISFSISTGNEASTTVEDYVDYLNGDENTHVIAMIVELFRAPGRFLRLVRECREQGKHIVLLHPGRSSAARESATTHTGAIAGDYDVMRTVVERAGVIVVDTLEELIDVSQILIRCPALPKGGAAVLTESGAFKAMALDFCEGVGLELPPLSAQTADSLKRALPEFIPPTNPLDITAQALVDPDLYRRTLPLLLRDERYGSVVLSIILTDERTAALKFGPIFDAVEAIGTAKPILFAALDEGAQVSPSYAKRLRELGVPFFPAPERAFRALARVSAFGTRSEQHVPASTVSRFPIELAPGVLPEYKSKEVLSAAGIAVPRGRLARTVVEAQAIAGQLAFPVALKAQSASLAHKSDVGGVVLNVRNLDAVTAAWKQLHEDVARAHPELQVDGVLVEQMGRQGAEVIVGARHDSEWGPILVAGFGGVLAEAIQDVRLMAVDLSLEEIKDELGKLRSAPLLNGFRGSPALDVTAAAEIVFRLGSLMRAAPEISEVDINPVLVYPAGQGALAVDAIIVVRG